MERMHFRPAEEFRASADVEFEAHRRRILATVPGVAVHEVDLFVPVRDLLAGNPHLLDEYKRLKQTHEGAPRDDYSREKAQLMEALVSRARDHSDAASPGVRARL